MASSINDTISYTRFQNLCVTSFPGDWSPADGNHSRETLPEFVQHCLAILGLSVDRNWPQRRIRFLTFGRTVKVLYMPEWKRESSSATPIGPPSGMSIAFRTYAASYCWIMDESVATINSD